jgi:ketosteroid isomerase-like protein
MSEENVEIVREMIDRFKAGDLESWRKVVAKDVIWDTSTGPMPAAGVYKGHEGVERFFIDWLGTWQDPQVESLELIDAGDSVVNVFRWSGRGKTSGVETEGTFCAVYDVEDGLVTRFRHYETREKALEAAGMSE